MRERGALVGGTVEVGAAPGGGLFDLDEAVYGALRAGASGFMLKDIRAGELVQAIRLVARGEALVAPTVTRRLLDRFADALRGEPPPELDELTRARSRSCASSRAH